MAELSIVDVAAVVLRKKLTPPMPVWRFEASPVHRDVVEDDTGLVDLERRL